MRRVSTGNCLVRGLHGSQLGYFARVRPGSLQRAAGAFLAQKRDHTKATNASTQSGTEIGSLLQGIATDVGRLIEQQFQLLRTDLNQQLDKARNAAISLGSGAGLVAVGGILGTLAGVHFLHRTTRLPLWSCYGLVGGLMGAPGAGLL